MPPILFTSAVLAPATVHIGINSININRSFLVRQSRRKLEAAAVAHACMFAFRMRWVFPTFFLLFSLRKTDLCVVKLAINWHLLDIYQVPGTGISGTRYDVSKYLPPCSILWLRMYTYIWPPYAKNIPSFFFLIGCVWLIITGTLYVPNNSVCVRFFCFWWWWW